MTDDSNPVVLQKSNWTTIVTIASISGIFIIFILALRVAGFFTFTGSDPSSKVVAAALALVGGLVAAVVSIVGILLKYSIDQRTEARLAIEARRAAAERKIESERAATERKIESERASALQTQAEQRLNLEAAIRAVELLGTKEGSDIALQRTGALFALSSLNQHSLTLDLTAYLLEKNSLEPGMACTLIDAALKRGDEASKRQAVLVFYENAGRMITEFDTNAPRAITNWDDCLSVVYVREMAALALGKMLLARRFSIWQSQFEGALYTLLGALALAWQTESNDRLRSDTAAMLDSVLAAPSLKGQIFHPKKGVDLNQIKEAVRGSVAVTSRVTRLAEQLRTWSLDMIDDQASSTARH